MTAPYSAQFRLGDERLAALLTQAHAHDLSSVSEYIRAIARGDLTVTGAPIVPIANIPPTTLALGSAENGRALKNKAKAFGVGNAGAFVRAIADGMLIVVTKEENHHD